MAHLAVPGEFFAARNQLGNAVAFKKKMYHSIDGLSSHFTRASRAHNALDKDGTRGGINKRMPIVHRCIRIPNMSC